LKLVPREIVSIRVNDRAFECAAEPFAPLLDVLRDGLHLTGTRRGCHDGSCGRCAVLVDGLPTLSCCVLAASLPADEHAIVTVEGLAKAGTLSPLQSAFAESPAPPCPACTPARLVVLTGLLERNPEPSDAELREAIASVQCGCGTEHDALDAARRAIAAETGAPTR
jgi:aerobic-type carbon monoxide dehydrogenase small subunit (CoxS/CutS family)